MGVRLGTFERPPGAVLDPHRHRPQEACYVAEGDLTCTVVWVFPKDSYDEIDFLPAGD